MGHFGPLAYELVGHICGTFADSLGRSSLPRALLIQLYIRIRFSGGPIRRGRSRESSLAIRPSVGVKLQQAVPSSDMKGVQAPAKHWAIPRA